MSLRVLIVPEDPLNNGYILKPVVMRLLKECGKPKARVTVMENPRCRGYADALRKIRDEVVGSYPHMDLLLFIPDADVAGEGAGLTALEAHASEQGVRLLTCAAQPELEAWVLAGHTDKLQGEWQEIRNHPRLKEAVFAPFLAEHGDSRLPGGGREQLTEQALANFGTTLKRCPELAILKDRIAAALADL